MLGIGLMSISVGYIARKQLTAGDVENIPPAKARTESAKFHAKARGGAKSEHRSKAVLSSIKSPSAKSQDTLADVMALDQDERYGRLALWLLDASEQDIEAYWKHHLETDGHTRIITDLIMINWTRVNPQAATAAVDGTSYQRFAWWAWTCSDPQAAMKAAEERNKGMMFHVMWGVAEFHPKWYRENFDKIPAASRGHGMGGFLKWGETDDAVATMEFLKQQGRQPSAGLLRNFIKQDPWAAYKWHEKRSETMRSEQHIASMKPVFTTLAQYHPAVLEQLITMEPSGLRKRLMEGAAFDHLLKIDPAAALERARVTASPWISQKRMAAVALRLTRQDMDKSLEIAGELFTNPAYSPHRVSEVEYPDGSWSSRQSNKEAEHLIKVLVSREPERLMEMDFGERQKSLRHQVHKVWSSYDVSGYAQWLLDQKNPQVVETGAPFVSKELRNMQRYDEAADWALGSGAERSRHMGAVLRDWRRADVDGARAWLESIDLPNQERRKYQRILD